MKKLPHLLSPLGFWMAMATIALLLTTAGIVLGGWLAGTKDTGAVIGGVVSSFLGALATVTGAAWIQSRKESREQKKSLTIITRIIDGIRATATEFADKNRIPDADEDRLRGVRKLLVLRSHLIQYRPYQSFSDGDVPLALLDVDMNAAAFEAFAGEATHGPLHTAAGTSLPINVTGSPREKKQLMHNGLMVLRACNNCLACLGQPIPEMSEYLQVEMRREYGNVIR